MEVRVSTVKELKELLKKLSDWAEVEHSGLDDSIRTGVSINYSEGTPWSSPYICFES